MAIKNLSTLFEAKTGVRISTALVKHSMITPRPKEECRLNTEV